MVEAYRELASAWSRAGDVEILTDTEADSDPSRLDGRAVWVLDAGNTWASRLGERIALRGPTTVELGGRDFDRADHSFVFAGHPDDDPGRTWGYVSTGNAAAIPGLARKLPHYKKYSYLVFQGDEPTNVHKGEWSVAESPLVWQRPGAATSPAPVASAPPLVERKMSFEPTKMMAHASALTDRDLQGRVPGSAGIERAARYIAGELRLAGLLPAGDDGYFQTWRQHTGPEGESVRLENVIGILPGTTWRDECVIVAAHYDHLGRGWPQVHAGDAGKLHPGADDNASGVAVALELARVLAASAPPRRNILFVFFTGEEADLLGSLHYVDHPVYELSRTTGVVNLDTVGRLYGNKLRVFGAESTREMPHVIRGAGYVTGVPVEMAKADMGASDQLPFHRRGVPAVQLFSGPHIDYHRPTDTVDKLDGGGMAVIAAFARETIDYLAAHEGPLEWVLDDPPSAASPAGRSGAEPAARPDRGTRRVSLGSVPDFGFEGVGVRIEGTVPDSPAAAAGLVAGDVIVGLGDQEIASLRDLSTALKGSEPGARVTLVYLRDGDERRVEVMLVAR
jgi:hypothetical protein